MEHDFVYYYYFLTIRNPRSFPFFRASLGVNFTLSPWDFIRPGFVTGHDFGGSLPHMWRHNSMLTVFDEIFFRLLAEVCYSRHSISTRVFSSRLNADYRLEKKLLYAQRRVIFYGTNHFRGITSFIPNDIEGALPHIGRNSSMLIDLDAIFFQPPAEVCH